MSDIKLTNNFTFYTIYGRDPLIFRDGRPFDNTPGSRAKTIAFPLPITLIGAIRTQAGSTNGCFDASKITKVLKIGIKGPWLTDKTTHYLPAPLDALMLQNKEDTEKHTLHTLEPISLADEGAICNDPAENLLYVGSTEELKGKPKGMPAFWTWEEYKKWLLAPEGKEIAPKDLGISGLTQEDKGRTHVSMNPETGAAKEGALFSTTGLEFSQKITEKKASPKDLYLAIATQRPELAPTYPLGGEGRLAYWGNLEQPPFATPDQKIIEEIVKTGRCRVVLITPAYFTQGWQPSYLCEQQHGVIPTLRAAAVNRPLTVSGWDAAERKPKPTRRLAPAGSVYFLELSGTKENIRTWATELWFSTISDTEQDRIDGLGLVLLGTWNPKGGK